jgi:uncharacterized protein Smg (DUF494 family)
VITFFSEVLLDERIMNIVSLITDQVQTKQDLFRNEGKIMDSLMSSGYRLHEADAALTLMQTLSQSGDETGIEGEPVALPAGMRTMNAEERSRFTMDAFSFVTKLANIGIIADEQREELLEKALSIHSGRIELAQMKTLLALDLFADEQEYEELLSSALRHKGTVWN